MPVHGRLQIAMASWLAGGCADPWAGVAFTDEGALCFTQHIAAVTVRVSAPECSPSSCTRNIESMCSVDVQGDRIEITSEFSWEEPTRVHSCTLDCRTPFAECSVGALADGTYTVVHGDEQSELVVPVGMETCPP